MQRDGDWTGGPAAVRNRLLFAVLAETGMRLGEALSLRHHDFHIGAGATPFIEIVDRQDHPHGVRVKTGSRRVYVGDDLEALYSEYVWQPVAMAADIAVPDLATHFVFVHLRQRPRFSPLRPNLSTTKCGRSSGLSPICRRSGLRTGCVTPMPPRCCWPEFQSMW